MSSKIPRATAAQMKSNSNLNKSKSVTTTATTGDCSSTAKPTNGNGNGKSTTSNRSFKKQNATFSHGTQKTMSYTQLKKEVGVLQEENCDLRNRVGKQQNVLNSSQKTTKHLQKENQELKEQIEMSEKEYTGSMETKTEEWTSKNIQLEDRLTQCEVKLEELGVDPVSLDMLDGEISMEDSHQQRAQAAENASILKQKLEENIVRSQHYIQQVKDITSQCQLALAELDG